MRKLQKYKLPDPQAHHEPQGLALQSRAFVRMAGRVIHLAEVAHAR